LDIRSVQEPIRGVYSTGAKFCFSHSGQKNVSGFLHIIISFSAATQTLRYRESLYRRFPTLSMGIKRKVFLAKSGTIFYNGEKYFFMKEYISEKSGVMQWNEELFLPG